MGRRFAWLLIALEVSQAACGQHAESGLPPVIFVPGFAGSLLDASLDRAAAGHSMCSRSGTERLWFNAEYFVPVLIDCWVEEMRLQLNVTGSVASSLELDVEPEGVHVHTIDYGSIEGSLYDYGMYHGGTGVWTPIIEQLQLLGFNASRMFAAPYDWRRGPGYWKQHDWPRLKAFVEEKVQEAGRPAIVMAVSQGSPYFAGFLHHGVEAEWKKEHVASFFSFSGVFGGTVGGLALALWGDGRPRSGHGAAYDLKVGFASRKSITELLRGWGGVSMLLPRLRLDSAFLQLPPAFEGNVTGENLQKVLWHVSPEFGALYDLSLKYPISGHPGVKTHCFFGSGLASPSRYVYLETPMNDSRGDGFLDKGLKAAAQLRRGRKPDLMSLLGGLGELAEEALESQSNATAPTKPAGPPGSRAWLGSAAELVASRQPDLLVTTDGDGLVPREALAVCEGWRGGDPKLDAEIHEAHGRRHGSELFDLEALLVLREAVAKVVGLPSSERDLPRPLAEFKNILGPEVANWDCQTWVRFYFGDGAVHGCAAELILASGKCDSRCESFRRDPEFLVKRCPETCAGRRPKRLGLDLPRPLAEFAEIVGPEVAGWSCGKWAGLYGALASGCAAEAILQAKNCDRACRSAFEDDGAFMRRRCPETCRHNGTDLARPLEEFQKIVGFEAASWDCPKWLSRFGSASCEAAALRAGRCDGGCQEALASDPFFVLRRCPETCSRYVHAAKDSTLPAPRARAVGGMQPGLLDMGLARPGFQWRWLLLLVLPCGLATRALRRRAVRRRPPEAGEAGTPLHDGADFSEFEGHAPPQRPWWSFSRSSTDGAAAAREVELQ